MVGFSAATTSITALQDSVKRKCQEDMTILQDSREQRPLEFPEEVEVEVTALPVGDYMVRLADGRVVPIAIERKSFGDLWGTMTTGYACFKAELSRARELNICVLLGIEASFSKVANGYSRSAFAGESMVRKLMTLWLRYGLRPVFCKNREELTAFILALFDSIGRHYNPSVCLR